MELTDHRPKSPCCRPDSVLILIPYSTYHYQNCTTLVRIQYIPILHIVNIPNCCDMICQSAMTMQSIHSDVCLVVAMCKSVFMIQDTNTHMYKCLLKTYIFFISSLQTSWLYMGSSAVMCPRAFSVLYIKVMLSQGKRAKDCDGVQRMWPQLLAEAVVYQEITPPLMIRRVTGTKPTRTHTYTKL